MNDLENGMTRTEFWLWGIGFFAVSWAGSAVIWEANPHCLEVALCDEEMAWNALTVFGGYALSIFTAYRRTIDIGCSRWWTLAGLIFLGWIILGLIPGQSAKTELGPSGERVRKSGTDAEFEQMQRDLDRWP